MKVQPALPRNGPGPAPPGGGVGPTCAPRRKQRRLPRRSPACTAQRRGRARPVLSASGLRCPTAEPDCPVRGEAPLARIDGGSGLALPGGEADPSCPQAEADCTTRNGARPRAPTADQNSRYRQRSRTALSHGRASYVARDRARTRTLRQIRAPPAAKPDPATARQKRATLPMAEPHSRHYESGLALLTAKPDYPTAEADCTAPRRNRAVPTAANSACTAPAERVTAGPYGNEGQACAVRRRSRTAAAEPDLCRHTEKTAPTRRGRNGAVPRRSRTLPDLHRLAATRRGADGGARRGRRGGSGKGGGGAIIGLHGGAGMAADDTLFAGIGNIP